MGDEEKINSETYWVFGLFAVLIILNFLIVHSFADKCSVDQMCVEGLNPWYVFVMRFQTFITGLLAIVAALITVRQMRKSDERADDRHEGLMRLQMRDTIQDRATLKFKFGDELVTRANSLRSKGEELENAVNDIELYERTMESCYRFVLAMQTFLQREEWENYQRSMTGKERRFLEIAITETSLFASQVAVPFHDDQFGEPILHTFFDYDPIRHEKLKANLSTIFDYAIRLSAMLDREY